MDGTNSEAGKKESISLNSRSSSFYFKWSEAVTPVQVNGGFDGVTLSRGRSTIFCWDTGD